MAKNKPSKPTKKNTHFKRKFNKRIKNKPLYINFAIMILSFIIIFSTLNSSRFYGIYNYQVNHVVKEDIFLHKDIVDEVATETLKEKRALEVQPIMYVDFSKQVESKKALTEFFSRLIETKNDYAADVDLMKRIYAGIERKNQYDLTNEELMQLATLSLEKLNLIQNYAIDISVENMSNGLTSEEIFTATANIENYVFNQTDITDFEKSVLIKFISGALVENKFVDVEKTSDAISAEMEKIEEVTYPKGMLFVAKGTILDEKTHLLLTQGGMLVASRSDHYMMLFGLFILLLMLWGILHLYLSYFEKTVLSTTKKYGILMSLFLVFFLSADFFHELNPYLIPLPAFSVLASIMITPTVAIYFGVGLLILISLWTGLSAYTMIAYLMTIMITRALVKNIKTRSQMVGIGLNVSLVLMLFTLTQNLINKSDLSQLPFDILFSAANGIICTIISIGIMPFFESFFGVLTPFKLLELSNPNRPLLKRLLIEAPGTYHHSILVGNLAETAAHDIGANSLLTRVASFYHDVGKLERPYYYKENQMGSDNPHDKLPPQISANFIKNHMTYGVELLEKNKLPKEIIDVVKAHHGTSLIKYFYHREQINNPDVDVSKFLYGGPKPDSKEAVVLMLADSVEAAVRSEESPTKDSITQLIDKIVGQKIAENQLASAEITFKELEEIKASFLKVLSGIFHERIAYPEINMDQISKTAFDKTDEKES